MIPLNFFIISILTRIFLNQESRSSQPYLHLPPPQAAALRQWMHHSLKLVFSILILNFFCFYKTQIQMYNVLRASLADMHFYLVQKANKNTNTNTNTIKVLSTILTDTPCCVPHVELNPALQSFCQVLPSYCCFSCYFRSHLCCAFYHSLSF